MRKTAVLFIALGVLACGKGFSPPESVDAGTPGLAQWVLEAPGVAGQFQSPIPGDIWAGEYHRVNGAWVRPFTLSGDLVWVASPTEVWVLESTTGDLHIWTPNGTTAFSLRRPGRVFTAIGEGWIAFDDQATTCCRDSMGLTRRMEGGWDEFPLANASQPVASVYMGRALSQCGEIYGWNDSSWVEQAGPGYCGPAMFAFEALSGTSTSDLYAASSMAAWHFDGSSWQSSPSAPGHDNWQLWVKPYGPRWAIGGGAAGDEMFEWDGAFWQDRGAAPGQSNVGGGAQVGSDGTDVFVSDYDGIWRLVR